MWGMIFIVEVESSPRVEEKHFINLKTYIWNSCPASSFESVCHMGKPQINKVCKQTLPTAGQET